MFGICAILFLSILLGHLLSFAVIKRCLESAKLFIEVHKNVGATDLNQRIVSRFEKDDVLFVEVAEKIIAHHFVDNLPIARNQALLVQVDVVTFDHFLHSLRSAGLMDFSPLADQMISDLISVDPLKRVAKSLQTLCFSLSQKLLNDFRKQIDEARTVLEFVLRSGQPLQFCLLVELFGADNDRVEETSEIGIILDLFDVQNLRNFASRNFLQIEEKLEESLGRANFITTFQGHVKIFVLVLKHLLVLLVHGMLSIFLARFLFHIHIVWIHFV